MFLKDIYIYIFLLWISRYIRCLSSPISITYVFHITYSYTRVWLCRSLLVSARCSCKLRHSIAFWYNSTPPPKHCRPVSYAFISTCPGRSSRCVWLRPRTARARSLVRRETFCLLYCDKGLVYKLDVTAQAAIVASRM